MKEFFAAIGRFLAELLSGNKTAVAAPKTQLRTISRMPKYGETGEHIGIYQQALLSRGFDPGPIDNSFKELTKAAGARFQKANAMEGTGYPGPKTLELLGLVIGQDEEFVEVPLPSGDWFGAPWIGIDLDLLGRSESDPELNRRYVPEWAKVGLPSYKTLIGNTYAWCLVRMTKALRQVGVNVKGLTAAAKSVSTYGRKCPFWFGALLDIQHSSGGRHGAFFLYWIDESKKLAATLDGNKGNRFWVVITDLSGKTDKLVTGPRWPSDRPDGQFVSMAQVLAKYPILKVGSKSSGGSTR